MKPRRLVEVALGIGLGGGLLYWVLRDYPWHTLRAVRWDVSWLIIATLFLILAHFLRAWRWRLFLRSHNGSSPSTAEAFWALMVGYLVNLGLPRAGEIVRCSLLYRQRRLPMDLSLGTVIGERVLDVGLLGLWAAVVVSVEGVDWLRQLGLWQWLPAILGAAGISGVGVWILYRRWRSLPWPWAKRLTGGLLAAFTLRPRLLNLLLSVGIWLCYWIETWTAGRGVGYAFGAWDAWILLVGSGLAMALPVPGGFGTFHAVGFLLLAYLGYPDAPAKTIVLLFHAFQTLCTILLGVIGILYFLSKRPSPHQLVA